MLSMFDLVELLFWDLEARRLLKNTKRLLSNQRFLAPSFKKSSNSSGNFPGQAQKNYSLFYQNVEISLGSKTAEWFILLNQSPKQSLRWIEMYDEYIRKDDQRRGTDCLDQTIDQLFPQNVDRIIHYADSANSFVWKFVTALWQQMAFFWQI